MAADKSAPAKKSSLTVSRIVLFAILIVALGGLAFDWNSRQKMQRAADSLKTLVDEREKLGDEGKIQDESVKIEDVRKLLGAPSTSPDKFSDVYEYPGVFQIYRLTVFYKVGNYDHHLPEAVFRFGDGG